MNTTHLKCPKCDGEFDFEEPSIVKRPGISAMATIKYNGHEMPVHVTGQHTLHPLPTLRQTLKIQRQN